MRSFSVRVDAATMATVRALAEKDKLSLKAELARAVEAYRRERFFAELTASYALAPEEPAEDEDWTGFEA
jgi:hypothetical protein